MRTDLCQSLTTLCILCSFSKSFFIINYFRYIYGHSTCKIKIKNKDKDVCVCICVDLFKHASAQKAAQNYLTLTLIWLKFSLAFGTLIIKKFRTGFRSEESITYGQDTKRISKRIIFFKTSQIIQFPPQIFQ